MIEAILCTFSVIAILLSITSSIEVPSPFFSINICNLRKEILRKCEDFTYLNLFDNLICKGSEITHRMYDIDCSSYVREELDIILIVKSEELLYYCSLKLANIPISSTESIPQYELEYFNCNWLSELNILKFPQGSMYNHNSERRIQGACDISLNLYSVFYI